MGAAISKCWAKQFVEPAELRTRISRLEAEIMEMRRSKEDAGGGRRKGEEDALRISPEAAIAGGCGWKVVDRVWVEDVGEEDALKISPEDAIAGGRYCRKVVDRACERRKEDYAKQFVEPAELRTRISHLEAENMEMRRDVGSKEGSAGGRRKGEEDALKISPEVATTGGCGWKVVDRARVEDVWEDDAMKILPEAAIARGWKAVDRARVEDVWEDDALKISPEVAIAGGRGWKVVDRVRERRKEDAAISKCYAKQFVKPAELRTRISHLEAEIMEMRRDLRSKEDSAGGMRKGEEDMLKISPEAAIAGGWKVVDRARVEDAGEERGRERGRKEAAEKWKQLYLAIKVELDELIRMTKQGEDVDKGFVSIMIDFIQDFFIKVLFVKPL